MTTTVKDATFDVLRRTGMTTIFCNPGSTEVALLTDLPGDLDFVLALHEGSVVGMATGWALARRTAALTVLHTTAGLGNAVGALATARVNRVPLVVIVGQQDRRHLALEPFLTGRLEGLAGGYPVWTDHPVRPQDLPGAIARARHEAETFRGPAVVVAHMDDWSAPWTGEPVAAPARLLRPATAVPDADLAPLVDLLAAARTPAIVAGAGVTGGMTTASGTGRDAAERAGAGWDAVAALAERLDCPVFQEPFGALAGFPQDHPRYAGVLPSDRTRLRGVLAGHDVVLAVGAPVFRQYPYAPGPLVPEGTAVALVTDDPAEAHRSPADLAYLAPPAAVCTRLTALLPPRHGPAPTGEASARSEEVRALGGEASALGGDVPALGGEVPARGGEAVGVGGSGAGAVEAGAGVRGDVPAGPLRAADVLRELARRLPADAVLVEETPSARPDLHRLVPARNPLGFVSAAMGGLGFGVPAAVGLRMALPGRPVVAVVGDGSALYGVQALWSAAHYQVGALFVVLSNGRYAIMDRLAERQGGKAPWPAFPEVDMGAMARSLGCPAVRVERHADLVDVLDEVLPTLASRDEPLLLDIAVAVDLDFQP
ncbi:thiamine pyrophosphate-dependent enzyme [Nonomuraea pusilla]|uniref:Benzoylformate decarboxylase n=1 Tax=Nonomuraea pusilla TaxID=46177 RepID=A0A1H7VFC9_9ACTN|nr:thiamine pyrophosphate-dependent enzyme [Nonomuraea pusilla]SEM07558.1 benzoylformate decarboxylase [Nonomuraea pusilla]